MATITENVTTVDEVEYETPVYRKIGTTLFYKIFSASAMLSVDKTTGRECIKVETFPNSKVRSIGGSTVASDETEFEAEAAAVIAALELIITPA